MDNLHKDDLTVDNPALLAMSDIELASQQNAAMNGSMNQILDATPLGGHAEDDQDSMRREEAGFVGFESTDEVLRYLKFKDQIFIQSVIVVEPFGPDNAARVDAGLIIPLRTRGYILGVLPEQSPHAKDLAFFPAQLEHTTDAVFATAYAEGRVTRRDFPEWWISSGGKFHMVGMDEGFGNQVALQDAELNHHTPINVTAQISANVNVYAPLNTNSGMPQNAGHVAPPNAPAVYQGNSASSGASHPVRKLSGFATPKPGLYQFRALPAGALRIWREIGADVPVSVTLSHRSEHPVYTHAPFYTVDLRLLGDVYITAHELLTWFPDHLVYWPDCVRRLGGAGWTNSDMVKFIYVVRGMTSSASKEDALIAERDISRIGHYRGDLGLTQSHQAKNGTVPQPYADLTCANFQDPRRHGHMQGGDMASLIDYYVSDLVDGVVPTMYPTGANASALTDVIQLVKDFPDYAECRALKLSGVSAFAKQMGLFRTAAEAGLQTSMHSGATHADSTALAAAAALVRRPEYEVAISGRYSRKARTSKN
ncbi:hypothetical protein SLS60_002959 [Paraconiothyrium brasiliense]|uniref:Uncharacterized protein n=1 Tax=Paraconiothyrium brasiliense TaxID=300254 RepID=A0ABR3RUB1_9PLEO